MKKKVIGILTLGAVCYLASLVIGYILEEKEWQRKFDEAERSGDNIDFEAMDIHDDKKDDPNNAQQESEDKTDS